ncbi:LemA family protein [Ideonella alba]|uniref:LemA family protein n=1 Tax=Ideonella alba TaxID=2824118 RepID=A0A941BFA7_9BURK|nr:LemA family protein [Ideonella alba]MBQ0929223.1 LemA family protein [Ideonella alba]
MDLLNWESLRPWLLRVAVLAVLLFWVVGAYNRLMRLRQALAQAWGLIDEQLTRRAAALEPLLAQLQEPMASEATTLAALSAALEKQQAAARAARARPASAVALQAWVVAEGELASPLARLSALVEQHADLAQSESIRPLRSALAEVAPNLAYARQTYTAAADAYNTAIEEFPTRLLMPVFRFRAAARV